MLSFYILHFYYSCLLKFYKHNRVIPVYSVKIDSIIIDLLLDNNIPLILINDLGFNMKKYYRFKGVTTRQKRRQMIINKGKRINLHSEEMKDCKESVLTYYLNRNEH